MLWINATVDIPHERIVVKYIDAEGERRNPPVATSVQFASSDPPVAVVDEDGTIAFLLPGRTSISLTTVHLGEDPDVLEPVGDKRFDTAIDIRIEENTDGTGIMVSVDGAGFVPARQSVAR